MWIVPKTESVVVVFSVLPGVLFLKNSAKEITLVFSICVTFSSNRRQIFDEVILLTRGPQLWNWISCSTT